MKLTEVTLSYPFIQYRIDVTHFTARRSTAIEWLILESIQRVQIAQEYLGMTVEKFFSVLFGITDTNQLIRPCLLNLRDIGALQLDFIDSQTDMAQTMLSQLHLTPVGAAMQRDKKLPGAESTDRILFYYHVTANQLLRDSKSAYYQEKPTGIVVHEFENAEEIAFPAPLVYDTLERLKKQKEHPTWLMEETTIQQAVPAASELLWKSVSKSFNIGENMQCSIDDSSADVASAVLAALNLGTPDSALPMIPVNNPDMEFKAIVPSEQLQTFIEKIDNDGGLFIADISCRLDNLRLISGKETKIIIRIFCNAEETKVKIERGIITAFVAESILPNSFIYLDKSQAIGHGVFSLSAGNISRLAELVYIPRKTE